MARASLKDNLFQRYLCWQARPSRLVRHLRQSGVRLQKTKRQMKAESGNDGRLRVAAAQIKVTLFSNPLDYVDEMHSFVRKAASRGAKLIAFPEENGIGLLGLLPGMEAMSRRSVEEALEQVGTEIKVADIFSYLGPVTQRIIMGTFSTLAAGYGLYIVAGSFLLPVGGKVVNRSFLFAPDGSLVGTQDKVHLLPLEAEWGIARGDEFHVFSTCIARLAIPICMDATYYETFRILEMQGADIVVVPIANPEPYNYWLALRGIQLRVQESLVYGVKSALVGELFGFTFTGRAGVFAPLDLTPEKDGVLVESAFHNQADLVVADLDLKALYALRREHPYLGDHNKVLYKKYFPRIYG
jgi:predicted amidohydrolase